MKDILVSTAIGLRKYRIPSDLRSQAQYRSVSTMVGDHMGIPGVVVLPFASSGQSRADNIAEEDASAGQKGS